MNTIAFYRSKMKRRVRQARRNGYELNDFGGTFYGWTYNNAPVEMDVITRGACVKVKNL